MFNDKTYNVLKKLVQVILPAIASLYFGLANIWNLPAADEVVGTLAVITTFLGVSLGVSINKYNNSDAAYDGNIIVTDSDVGPKNYLLELSIDPDELTDKKDIKFKVKTGDDVV